MDKSFLARNKDENNPDRYKRGASGKSIADEKYDAEAAELRKYRNSKDYGGYEDYAPSGRAAIEAYNKASAGSKELAPGVDGRQAYSPKGAAAAQKAQRDTMNELKRESRGTVPDEELKKGGKVKKYARGGGIEIRGKTKGKMC